MILFNSIDDIHELKYVALRFGKLPLSQIEKIKYFDSYPFVYQELSHSDQFAWVVYGGVEHSIGEIDNIFSSMNFEEVKLPKSNVLKYVLEDDSWFVVRPSGTEPKMKVYLSVVGESLSDSEVRLSNFRTSVMIKINGILG